MSGSNKEIWRPTRRDVMKLGASGGLAVAETMVVPSWALALPSRTAPVEEASFPPQEAGQYPWREYAQTIFVEEQPQNPDESLSPQPFATVEGGESSDGRAWCRTEMSGAQVNQELSGDIYLPNETIYRLSVRDITPDNICGLTSYFQCDVVVGTQEAGVGAESDNRMGEEWFTRNPDESYTFETIEFVSTIGEKMLAHIQQCKDDELVSPDLVGKILFLNFGEYISGGATQNYPEEDTLPETTVCRPEATPIIKLNTKFCYRSPSDEEERQKLSLLQSAVGHEMIHIEHVKTSFPPRLTEPFATSHELKNGNLLPDPDYVQWRKDLFDDAFFQNHTFRDMPHFDQEHYLWLDMALQDEGLTLRDFWQRFQEILSGRSGELCTDDEVDDIRVFEEIFGRGTWISSRMKYLMEISTPVDRPAYTELLRSRREKMPYYRNLLSDGNMVATLGPGAFGYFSVNMDEPNTSYVIRYIDSNMQIGAVVNGVHRHFIDTLELNGYAQNDSSLTFVGWNTDPSQGRAFEIQKRLGKVRRRYFFPFLRE